MKVDRTFFLPQLLERRAARHPLSPVVQRGDGTGLTYADLHRASLRYAVALRAAGVGAGDHVVTVLPSSPDAFGAWLGAAWLRAVEVPAAGLVGTMQLAHVIADCGARVVVTSTAFLDAVHVAVDGTSSQPELVVIEAVLDEGIADVEFAAFEGPAHFDTTHLTYTSGTTGAPKGVVVPWAQLYYLARFPLLADSLQPGKAFHTCMPVHHGLAKISLYLAVAAGARLVLSEASDASTFWDEVRRLGCTNTILTPHMAAAVLTAPRSPADRDHPLRGVTLGPRFPGIGELHDRFGVRLRSWFGGTELNVVLVTDDAHLLDWRTCGHPPDGPPGMEVRVVDEHDDEVPPGTVGELIVRTSAPWALNAGYHGLPEQTARVWRNGWYHSGDAFRVEAGEYYFVDRVADLIRGDGSVLSSVEIDAVLSQHPAVAEVATVGVAEADGDDVVVAFVVRRTGTTVDVDELRAFAGSRLPAPQVPARVEFVEALPRTPITHKVRKATLRSMAR